MRNRTLTYIACLAVLLTAGAVWFAGRTSVPRDTTWEDVLAEAKTGGYRVITTEELADRYRKEPAGLLLVDTRQDWEFRTGHLKDARNFPMEPTWWSRWRSASALEAFLGPDRDRAIVFY